MKRNRRYISVVVTSILACMLASVVVAENIDPMDDGSQYSWGENVGWINWEPSYGPGCTVGDYTVTGYLWGENIGWINLSPTYGGVTNDGAGNLTGYAWGENVGWINFNPTYGGVAIDDKGYLEGWAWGENIGWIHLEYDIDLTIEMNAVNDYSLYWNSELNFIYEVWISTDLAGWSVADSSVVGMAMMTQWDDVTSATKKFYKVKRKTPAGYQVRTSW
jgi:hypothetical protein